MAIESILVLLFGISLGVGGHYLALWAMDFMTPSTLSDVLQWETLADDRLVGTKDRSFIAVWEVQGPDLTFATSATVDSLASKMERALRTLDENTVLHVDAVRLPAHDYATADSDVPAPLKVMDKFRASQYRRGDYFETPTYLALTISEEQNRSTFFSNLFYTGEGARLRDTYQDLVHSAELRAEDFEANIPTELNATRLTGDALTTYLHTCLTGHHHSVTSPPTSFPSLRHLFASDLQSGFEPRVGDNWFCVVGVWGYPRRVQMGVVETLKELDFPFRYSNRLIGMSQAAALKAIETRQKSFQLKANDYFKLLSSDPDAVDPHELKKDTYSQELALETKHVSQNIQAGERLFHHTGLIIVWDPVKARAEKKARIVKKVLRNSGGGFVVQQEEGLGTEAFIGSLCGHASQNPRRYLLLSETVTRLLPIMGAYPGPLTTPSKHYVDLETGESPPPLFYAQTDEHTPYRFSPFGQSGDVGHQMVVGPTGTGKSILLGFMAARQLHFRNGRSILFDRGHSFAPLCEAMDGKHYDLSRMGETAGFMPLSRLHIESERRWATSWIADIASMSGVKLTPGERNALNQTLHDMARTAAEKQDRAYLTMRELAVQVQNQNLKAALQPFCGSGELGGLLNASTDILTDNDFIVIELGDLMDLDVHISTPVLMYLFHKVETMLSATRPTHVVADEFFVFSAKSAQGRQYVENALRTWRKKNAFITIATQSPSDLIHDEMAGIVNSIMTKIMLPNPNALDTVQSRAYEHLGLNDKQIRVLAQSKPKCDYVSLQPGGTRRFNLGLSVELAFLTSAPGLSLADTADLMFDFKRRFGSTWIASWLRYRGFTEHLTHAVVDRRRGKGRREPLLLPEPDDSWLLPHGEQAPGDGPIGDGGLHADASPDMVPPDLPRP